MGWDSRYAEEGYRGAANAGGGDCAFGAAIYASRAIFTFSERYCALWRSDMCAGVGLRLVVSN